MEMTEEQFQIFVERAFNFGYSEGVKFGIAKAENKRARDDFERETGYDYNTYKKAKDLVNS